MIPFRTLLTAALLAGAMDAAAQSYRAGQQVEAALVNGGVSFDAPRDTHP